MTLHTCLGDLPKINSFAQLPESFYSRVHTQSLKEPRLLHANERLANDLGLSTRAMTSPDFLSVVSGNQVLPGGQTVCAVYSGHQFGVWAGQLGDGRAHLLGSVQAVDGQELELQLKGAGMTPYSRMGDGRAVIRSSVREYLASEAMYGLGIPTTRALALVVASDAVMRETVERAAVVTRVAPSFIRFGSFEHWSARKRPVELKVLADYVIKRFYPHCLETQDGSGQANSPYVELLRAVSERTADLMASWQVVGFCHGVMNTDNMSILGLTLDYGPYGFMDGFNARHICNHTDTQGRYAWHAQPAVANWNLYQLAQALYDLVPDAEALQEALTAFEARFLKSMQEKMLRKLGFQQWLEGDEGLIDELWSLMHANKADFTLSFRQLAHAPGVSEATPRQIKDDLGATAGGALAPFLDLFADRDAAQAWLSKYQKRLGREALPWQERVKSMLATNPLYVLRNHLAQKAIEGAEQGDASELRTLLSLMADPYRPHAGMEAYAAVPPDWASHIEVSCSS